MTVLDAVLARFTERGVRNSAGVAALAYVAMVATTTDGGSWPGLPIEVTDRAGLIDALVTAVEVRTLERRCSDERVRPLGVGDALAARSR